MLKIVHGRVIDPAGGIDEILDVTIEGGKITALGKPKRRRTGSPGGRTRKDLHIIDATGQIVIPGLIDMHTHLREPGHEYKETIKTGCEAAAEGGFTSVVCMANTEPVNDNQSVTDYILTKARTEGCARVYPVGAITKELRGERLAEIGELKEAGVVAISDDGRSVRNSELMRRGMEYARNFHLLAAEEVMVARDIALAELTRCPLHIAHVSTEGSVRLIREAKARGIRISAEVTPHHLTLSEEAAKGFDTNTKVSPPLRTPKDIQALKEGLRDGTIDVIATDHAPHSLLEKDVEFDLAAFGIIGLETALPLTLQLVREKAITLPQAIAKLTSNPAKILGIDHGTVHTGKAADLAIIDPDVEWSIDAGRFRSKSRNTPFHAWQVRGKATHTIVGGRVVKNPTGEAG
jgi:dihydroorotase